MYEPLIFGEALMLLILMLMQLKVDLVAGRVFCQDSHAMAWMPRGFTCPVMCDSVRNAIERLIMLDYKNVVQEQFGNKEKNNMMTGDDIYEKFLKDDIKRPVGNSINVIKRDKHKLNFDEIKKDKTTLNFGTTDKKNNIKPFLSIIIKNLRKTEGILRRSAAASAPGYNKQTTLGKCWALEKFEAKFLLGKLVRKTCTRKSNFDGNFLSIMTNVLNKYVDTKFDFTEEMTEILLEHIFGKNTDLRNNIFDVNKLLKFLRNSLDLHNSHIKNEITLKSRHCLSIPLPGCFCRRGYVEDDGQCVAPSDCIRNEYYTQYLSRIIIH